MKYSAKLVICAITVLAGLMPVLGHAQGREVAGPLVIRGGWLFDGISDTRRRNSGIVIRDGKIAALDVEAAKQDMAGATVIDLADTETVLPGMFDLHAHYNLDLVDRGRVEEVVNNGIIFLANGVTSTWSAGEFYPERVIAQRDLIEAGDAIGPRLFVSGPYFGAFRCEYSIKVAEDDCIAWPNKISAEEIRDEVDKWAKQGVISIKIKQASPGEAKTIIEQAHKNGMTVAGHLANYKVEYDVTTRVAILMGIDRIEHQLTLALEGSDSTRAEMRQMVDLMLEHQVFYDATLQMYGGINEIRKHADEMLWVDEARYFTPYTQKLLEERGPPSPESDEPEYKQRVLELKTLYDAGGENLLIVGTDEPVYTSRLPGFAYHRELLAMTYAGLSPIAVLKAATINGATALGVDDRLGSIETGKLGDLVVVRGNPLDDIKAARDIRIVVKQGVVYDPEALLGSVEGKIGPKGPDDHADWELHIKPLRPGPVQPTPREAKETQPNILFIVADNQPASILGAYGNPDVKTPNIDRLANEGLRFTRAFAVHGMCSPTRATLLTGLLPSQHGVQDWLDDEEMKNWPSDWNAIREYRTLPYTLKNRGYQTALIGKWHLGQPRLPYEWFDYWVTFNLGHTVDRSLSGCH